MQVKFGATPLFGFGKDEKPATMLNPSNTREQKPSFLDKDQFSKEMKHTGTNYDTPNGSEH